MPQPPNTTAPVPLPATLDSDKIKPPPPITQEGVLVSENTLKTLVLYDIGKANIVANINVPPHLVRDISLLQAPRDHKYHRFFNE